MRKDADFDTTWEDIYSRGEQLNLYPYDRVVAFMMRHFAKRRKTETIKVLEIGCGAGNNLWFAAREGFDITGLDASADAISFAQSRFQQDQLEGRFVVGSFSDLPFEDQEFDLVIDRAASTNVNLEIAKTVISEVKRVLKAGGIFYSEVFSDHASSRGDLLSDGVLANIDGPYSGAGHIYFYSRSEIQEIYNEGWSLEELSHYERKQYLDNGVEIFAQWVLAARKGD